METIYSFLPLSTDKLAAGSDHSFFLTKEGQLFGCGNNTRGQLGLRYDHKYQRTWAPLLVPGNSVKEISCSSTSSLLVTDDNQLLVTGTNYDNNIGLSTSGVDKWTTPGNFPASLSIKQALTG